MSLLTVTKATKTFGGVAALTNISLSVEAGEILGIMREIKLVLEPKAAESITGFSDQVIKRMRERIGLRPEIELVSPGTLPRFELKAKRFFKL